MDVWLSNLEQYKLDINGMGKKIEKKELGPFIQCKVLMRQFHSLMNEIIESVLKAMNQVGKMKIAQWTVTLR